MARKSLDDLGALQKAIMETVWERGAATVQQVTLAARRDRAVKAGQASAESQRELRKLTTALTRLEQTLADLQKARARNERKY